MDFGTKTAFVITLSSGSEFYIDTDAEKIAFIDWFLANLQMFENESEFRGYMCKFQCGTDALYLEQRTEHVYADETNPEIIYPVRNDEEKLALFEQICKGELSTYVDEFIWLKNINVRVLINKKKTAELLTQVPIELTMDLAGKIVEHMATSAPVPSAGRGALPPGWFAADADGVTYYYTASGQLQWKRPRYPAPAVGPPPQPPPQPPVAAAF